MDSSNEAVEYYINNPNSSIRKVSKMFNIDRRRLSKLLKAENIEIINHKSRKYYCNFNYFDDIDSEEKAYWLGFILADGCIDKQNKFEATFNYNNKVPNKYINSYLRGIFDGDGWFVDSRHTKGKSKEIGFCGTEKVCLGIQQFLKNTFGMNYKVTQDKSIYRIRISSTVNILKLYNFMYKDATYFLKRKYEKLKLFADSNETIK